MKITFIIKKTAKRYDTESAATIYLRLRDGRRLDSVAQTELTINPNLWDEKNECVKSKAVCDSKLRIKINEELRKLKGFIEREYERDKDNLDKDWLKAVLVRYYHPEKFTPEGNKKQTFEQMFDEFLEKHRLSEVRKKNFRVVKRSMLRYELYVKKTKRNRKDFVLDVNEVTRETLADMWDFFENEYKYFEKYPQIYENIPEKRTPQPRGKNTLIDCFSRIRTFFLWCYENGKTTNRPFDKFPIEECLYGTPVYISLDEREQIWNADLSARPQLAIQRDIFIFQSVIGCRVSDLYRMTKQSIVNGAIEYIPKKTKEGRPLTVRVPLNERAKEILKRYEDFEGPGLLPFISEQKYNKAIKEFFKLAGIDRIVTTLDPLAREEQGRIEAEDRMRREGVERVVTLTRVVDSNYKVSANSNYGGEVWDGMFHFANYAFTKKIRIPNGCVWIYKRSEVVCGHPRDLHLFYFSRDQKYADKVEGNKTYRVADGGLPVFRSGDKIRLAIDSYSEGEHTMNIYFTEKDENYYY